MTEQPVLCSVYKTDSRDEMYLYVPRQTQPFEAVPEALMASFQNPQHVLDVVLTPEKRFARVDASVLLSALAEQGYYLQMPPSDSVPGVG